MSREPILVTFLLARSVCLLALPLLILSCAGDAAEQEYLAALRGEETGMTRTEQLAHLDRAIALEPGRAWYRETHAIYAIDLRRFDVAAADLDTAVQLADRAYLRFLRGLVACQRGQYGKSLPDFDRAIAEQPGNSQFYRGRSLARGAIGRYCDAMTDAKRLLALAPQQGETHYVLGMALAGMGRDQAAVSSFDESLRLRPELIYPLRARAAVYARLGDTLRASADREEAERKDQDHPHSAACLDPFRY